MRLEETFGQARKSPQLIMEQWMSQVSALATQISSVGVDVLDNRIANHILNGLGRDFMNLKHSCMQEVAYCPWTYFLNNCWLQKMTIGRYGYYCDYSEYSTTSIGSWSWNSQHGWIKFPHLKPRWIVEKVEWRKQRTPYRVLTYKSRLYPHQQQLR